MIHREVECIREYYCAVQWSEDKHISVLTDCWWQRYHPGEQSASERCDNNIVSWNQWASQQWLPYLLPFVRYFVLIHKFRNRTQDFLIHLVTEIVEGCVTQFSIIGGTLYGVKWSSRISTHLLPNRTALVRSFRESCHPTNAAITELWNVHW